MGQEGGGNVVDRPLLVPRAGQNAARAVCGKDVQAGHAVEGKVLLPAEKGEAAQRLDLLQQGRVLLGVHLQSGIDNGSSVGGEDDAHGAVRSLHGGAMDVDGFAHDKPPLLFWPILPPGRGCVNIL